MAVMKKMWTRFTDENKKRYYYLGYTLCFTILSLFIFSWFIFSDSSFIMVKDGWNQHFRALVYYGEYLKQILRGLISDHRLTVPEFDFYIGEGSDIMNAMHYYVMGDPIALLAELVPAKHMHIFYSFSCVLRLYLAGIAFSELAFGTGLKNRCGVIAGALTYSFAFWALLNVGRHPYFLNPMIYFPLMILGVEKIIQKKRPYLFIISVAVSAASNFYFFYMLVILTVVYTFIRLAHIYHKDLKNGILTLLRIGGWSVIGAAMAGIILLPVLMMFLQDSRLSGSQPFHLFYPLQYYSRLPSIAGTHDGPYWLCMGYSAPAVIAVFTLFIKKGENKFLKSLFDVCLIIIIFPIYGRILNGMSYMTNRWSWALALLVAFTLAKEWENLRSLSRPEWKKVAACTVVFYTVCLLLEKSRSIAAFAYIPLLFITLLLIREPSDEHKAAWKPQALLVLMVGVSAFEIAFWRYSPAGSNYVAEFKKNSEIQEELYNNETQIIRGLSDDPYVRYTGRSMTRNANFLDKVSNTQFYWSISNPNMTSFRTDLEMREEILFQYEGYDDRTAPIALSAVRYYVTKQGNEKGIPYGYSFVGYGDTKEELRQEYLDTLCEELGQEELTEEQAAKIENSVRNVYAVYQNDYALPLGYCYDEYITDEDWEDMDPIQKQEIQLEAAYVSEAPDGFDKYPDTIADYQIPYEVECKGTEITETETGFVTTAGKTKAVLSFEGEKNSETYIRFKGLEFVATPEYDLYFGDEEVDPLDLYNKTNWDLMTSDRQTKLRKAKLFWDYTSMIDITITSSAGTKKYLNYKTEDAVPSSGRHDFVINLGYMEKPVKSITITFPGRGRYYIDDLAVYCVPMEGYEKKIEARKENVLENISFGTNTINGEISLDEPKLLCVAVAYSSGWKAYVNGEETSVFPINERYLGISLPAGSHEIEFRYRTPFKSIGSVLTWGGIGALIVTVIIFEKVRRKDVQTAAERSDADHDESEDK